jgi:hypothetical protein
MEDADGHLEAWPVVRHLVPIALRMGELMEDIGPDATAEELALDLDPGLAPYAWAHPAEWAVTADVLAQIAEWLGGLEIHTISLPNGTCERRARRRPSSGR